MNKKYILSRRDFLRSAVATGAAVAFPTIVPSTVFGATAPGNRITMGMVGMGLQMGGHLMGMLGRSEVQVLAVCDVDQDKLQDAKNIVESAYADKTTNGTYKGCDAYREYEKIC